MSNPNDSLDKDLASIGQHCSLASCNRLDFLPVKCELCSRVFCKEHYSITSHNCEKFTSPTSETSQEAQPSKPYESFPCSFEGCSIRERVQVTCEFCSKDFCMKHRLQVDHKCSKLSSSNDKTDGKLDFYSD